MELTLNTIPTWVPGIVMVYTGFVWLVTRKQQIRMDSRTVALTLILWGVLYILGALEVSSIRDDELIIRILLSRVVIMLICLSQSIPMTVSYFRSIYRGSDGKQ